MIANASLLGGMVSGLLSNLAETGSDGSSRWQKRPALPASMPRNALGAGLFFIYRDVLVVALKGALKTPLGGRVSVSSNQILSI